MRATRGALAARWKIEGFLPAARRSPARRATCSASRTAPPTRDSPTRGRWTGSCGRAPASRPGRPAAPTRSCASSATASSSGTASRARSRSSMIGRDKVTGAPLGRAKRGRRPRLRADPKGERDPAGRAHPARPPAHAADRGLAHPAPRLQLLARHRPVRPARHGPRLLPLSAATSSSSSRSCRSASRASRWSTTSSPPAAATSSPPPGARDARTGSARACSSERPGRAPRRARLKHAGAWSIRRGVSGLMANARRSVRRFVRRSLIAGVVLAVIVLAAAVTATALPGANTATAAAAPRRWSTRTPGRRCQARIRRPSSPRPACPPASSR